MTEKEWVEYFEAVNGRKPNAKEFTEAKNKGEFSTSKRPIPEKNIQNSGKNKTKTIVISAISAVVIIALGIFGYVKLTTSQLTGTYYAAGVNGSEGYKIVVNANNSFQMTQYEGIVAEQYVGRFNGKDKTFELSMKDGTYKETGNYAQNQDGSLKALKISGADVTVTFFRDSSQQGKTTSSSINQAQKEAKQRNTDSSAGATISSSN